MGLAAACSPSSLEGVEEAGRDATEPKDTVAVTEPKDTVIATELADTVAVTEPADTSVATEPADTSVATEPADTVIATEPADTVIATEPADTVIATEPADTVIATEPTDTVVATEPADTVIATEPTDTVIATKPTDTVIATEPADTVIATEPTDTVIATEPTDTVIATEPTDTVIATEPTDTVIATEPTDTVIATEPTDTVIATEPTDTVIATEPTDTVVATEPTDTVIATEPTDTTTDTATPDGDVACEGSATDPDHCGACDIACSGTHANGASTAIATESTLTSAVGDFDGDGLSDIAMLTGTWNETNHALRIALGDGQGRFTALPVVPIGAGRAYTRFGGSVRVADLDADGQDDLVLCDAVDFQVLLSNGDGSFVALPLSVESGARVHDVAIADVDGDDDLDLIAESASGALWRLRGDGDGAFDSPVQVATVTTLGALLVADFDENHTPDLLAICDADLYCNQVAVVLGDADGTFSAPIINYGFPDYHWMFGAAVGDIDGDGHVDVAVARYNSWKDGPLVGFLRGLGNGRFERRDAALTDASCGTSPSFSMGDPVVADLDADGHLDVAVPCESASGIRVFLGHGGWAFDPPHGLGFAYSYFGPSLAAGDFDGDTIPDLVISRFTDVAVAMGVGDGAFDFRAGQHGVCVASACVAECDPGWADCNDDQQRDACEVDLRNDREHCGSCTGVCSSNHVAHPSCSLGACNGVCDQGFADCNVDKLRDGCEGELARDVAHCGRCDVACTPAHATPECRLGVCAIAACDSGWADCDHDPANGCEIDTTSDPLHCRSCDVVCDSGTGCVDSVCRPGCSTGREDCDGHAANGCEAILAIDPNNCADCGIVCSSNHANGVLGAVVGAATVEAAAVGDFDGDGLRDLAVRHYDNGTNKLNVFRADGTGGYAPMVPVTPLGTGYARMPSGMSVGDFDGDGRDDIVTTAPHLPRLLRSLGDGSFDAKALPLGVGVSMALAALGRFDGDTRLDFVGSSTEGTRLFRGVGDGTFTPGAVLAEGSATSLGMAAGDFDGDHHVDVLGLGAAVGATNTLTLWRGDGAGGFAPGVSVGTQERALALAGGDFNADGIPDVVVEHLPVGSTNYAPQSFVFFLADGAGAFSKTSDVYTQYVDYFAVGDFDGGHGSDLFVDGYIYGSFALVNHGDASFAVARAQPVHGTAGVATDLDADGRTDVLVSDGSLLIGYGTTVGDLEFYRGRGACSASTCTGTCDHNWADCDHDLQRNGCESNVASDAGNCGDCGRACSTFGVTGGGCAGGQCVGTCLPGYRDRNNDLQRDGCEGVVEIPVLTGPVPAVGAVGATLSLTGDRFSTFGGELRATFVPVGTQPLAVSYVTVEGPTRGTVRLPGAAGKYTLTLTQAGLTSGPLAVYVLPMTYSNLVASADFDDDGAADVAIATYVDATVGVRLGRGDGTFALEETIDAAAPPTAIAVGDFDDDTYPDVIVVSQDDASGQVFLGLGDGTLDLGHMFATGGAPTGVAVADLDADGNLDLAITNLLDDNVSVLLGLGDGSFDTPILVPAPANPAGIVAADFDDDGTLDLAVAGTTGLEVAILDGLGDGDFARGAGWPLGTRSRRNPVALVASDIDGNGAVDLVVGGDRSEIFLQQTDGTFAATAAPNLPAVALAAVDLDANGRLDVVGAFGDARASLQGATGGFAAVATYAVGDAADAIAVADFNTDGKPDLVVGNADTDKIALVLSTPDGLAVPGLGATDGPLVALADFDEDGTLDLVTAGTSWVDVHHGDGHGHFAAPARFAKSTGIRELAVMDVNGDHHADVVVLATSVVDVLLGDGSGALDAPITTTPSQDYPVHIALGQLDGDGDVDLVVTTQFDIASFAGNGDGTFGARARVMRIDNQGDGELAFTNHNFLFGLTLADTNGDGMVDLVFIDSQSTPDDNWMSGASYAFVLHGDGNRGFDVDAVVSDHESPAAAQGVLLRTAARPAVADLDSDGRADLACGAIFLGTETGLVRTDVSYGGRQTVLGDVTGDDIIDVLGTPWANSVAIYPGVGDGTLGPVQKLVAGRNVQSIAVGDLDGHGALDIVSGATGTGSGPTYNVILR